MRKQPSSSSSTSLAITVCVCVFLYNYYYYIFLKKHHLFLHAPTPGEHKTLAIFFLLPKIHVFLQAHVSLLERFYQFSCFIFLIFFLGFFAERSLFPGILIISLSFLSFIYKSIYIVLWALSHLMVKLCSVYFGWKQQLVFV